MAQLRLALSLLLLAAPVSAEEASPPRVRVSVIPETGAVAPGASVDVAVHFSIEPGWHIYWENPGDSGLATTVDVEAPPSVVADPARYPVPDRFEGEGGLVSYGWGGAAAMLFRVETTKSASAGELVVPVTARWLACRETCVVGEATRELRLTVDPTAPPPAVGTGVRFAAWRAAMPSSGPVPGGAWACSETGAELRVAAAEVAFFPTAAFADAGGRFAFEARGGEKTLKLESSVLRQDAGDAPWGVLRFPDAAHFVAPPCPPAPLPGVSE